MTRCNALFALGAVALPLLAACTTAGAAPVPITGTTWAFVSIDGQKPVSGKAAITIQADSLSASAGCNGMGSNLTITPDRLMVGLIISTQMFCDGVMEQERAVSRLLGASPQYTVVGDTLTLTAPGHSAKLVRKR
ncbi:MAG: META domain-containing protein [Novosphingobium sp.]